jgi:hypothetical protein
LRNSLTAAGTVDRVRATTVRVVASSWLRGQNIHHSRSPNG